jgi:hypothetical protein
MVLARLPLDAPEHPERDSMTMDVHVIREDCFSGIASGPGIATAAILYGCTVE